jgi:hypothetical protein
MSFPPTFGDISLFLGVIALILIITSEVLSPYYGKINITINRKRLRNVAYITSILFLAMLVIRIIAIILTP